MDNATATELKKFNILDYKFAGFEKDFGRLVRRAAKLGVAAPSFEVIRRWTRPAIIGYGGELKEPSRNFVEITVSGVAPCLAGWRFVAVIEHASEGNLIHRVPGAETIDIGLDVRTAPSHCDHCHTQRRRSETFIVQKIETGELKQVGRQCVADFLGGESPEQVARWAELIATFSGCTDEYGEDGFSDGSHRELRFSLVEFLSWVVKLVAESGWRSRTEARNQFAGPPATADQAWTGLTAKEGTETRASFGRLEQADFDAGKALVEWIDTYFDTLPQSEFDANEYLYNVRLIVDAGDVRFKTAGLAASIIRIRDRALGNETHHGRRKSADPQYVGEVGKRIVFKNLLVTNVADFDGQFGVSHIHIFLDEQGNVLKWSTGSERLTIGKTYNLKGTIKDHKEYKGTKQTVLSRCLVVDEKGKAIPEAQYK